VDLPTGALRQFRIELRRDYDKAMRNFAQKKRAAESCRHLRTAKHEFERIEIDAEGWEAIARGLKRTYRQCRDAQQLAAEQISAKRFHKWRKRAKNLWHQLVLLKPIWSEKLDRMACELEAVGDLLGEDHDLFMLEQTVLDWQNDADEPGRLDLNRLLQMIHQRQAELRQKALALGKSLHAEKPSKFCEQLDKYWGSWVGGMAVKRLHPRGKGGRR
jgi:CHAD domain-containing protein